MTGPTVASPAPVHTRMTDVDFGIVALRGDKLEDLSVNDFVTLLERPWPLHHDPGSPFSLPFLCLSTSACRFHQVMYEVGIELVENR